jgi:hypothetical protein
LPAKSRWGKILQWVLNKSDLFVFIFLCVKENPATVVIYFRKGAFEYNGMSGRDWKIFFASVLVANLIYIAILTGIIESIKFLWAQI